MRSSSPFLLLMLVAFVASACSDKAAAERAPATPAGPAAPGGQKQAKVLQVQVHTVQRETASETITASGDLLPNESVAVVAELSRRLTIVHAQEGDLVKAGDLLFELDRADLEAELARLQVAEKYGRAALGRRNALADGGIVSREERDSARATVEDAAAQAKEVEVQLAKTRIVAPFAGTVGLRQVSVGAWVGPTTTLVTLYDVSQLKLDFRVPERYAPLIDRGEAFTFSVAGRPEVFQGVVQAVEPNIEADTRSLVVRGLVADPQGLLPGTFASVTLTTSQRDAMFIPAIALMPSPTGTRVFVAVDGKAKQVEVELGRREPERVEIIKGLSPADKVIVTNLLRVRDGSPVEEITR